MKAGDIVRALAYSNPLDEDAACTLCKGEIPDGHMRDCPWWMAYQWVERSWKLKANQWLSKLVHRFKMTFVPSYRRRQEEIVKNIQQLVKALEAGHYSASPKPQEGAALKVELLEPVMKVVTFSDAHIKLNDRKWLEEMADREEKIAPFPGASGGAKIKKLP